jgi:hypothetical protein
VETKEFVLGQTVSFAWKQDGIDAVFTGEIVEFGEAGPFSGFMIPAAKIRCTDGRTRSQLLGALTAVEEPEATATQTPRFVVLTQDSTDADIIRAFEAKADEVARENDWTLARAESVMLRFLRDTAPAEAATIAAALQLRRKLSA